MHGRLKVRSSEEKEAADVQLKERKLAAFKTKWRDILAKRASHDYDPEMLTETQAFLQHCPDVGTVWNYRREILLDQVHRSDSQGRNEVAWKLELALTKDLLSDNPKSYNVWFHRRWVLSRMTDPNWNRELELCTYALERDERNFHCWDYRQEVVVKARAPLEKELAFSNELIRRNFSNYSAWHYRTVILPRLYPIVIPEHQLAEDVDFVINAIAADVDDQSAWFYSNFLLDQIQKAALPHLLSKLVDSIKEFSQTDPNNQWVLYTSVKMLLLTKKCLTDEDSDFIKESLNKLVEEDPLRRGCYESLKNDFLALSPAAGD